MLQAKTSTGLSLLILLTVGAVVTFGNLPSNKMFWAEVQNASHAPAFGVLAIAALIFFKNTLNKYRNCSLAYYLLSLGLCLTAGVAIELGQQLLNRDAELVDVIRDLLGAVSFLGVAFTFDTSIPFVAVLTKPVKNAVRLVFLLIFACAFISLILCVRSYLQRNQSFPQLCNFNAAWSRQFVKLESATITPAPTPAEWPDKSQHEVSWLRVDTTEYPGLTIEEPYPDWRSYRTFCLDLFSENNDTLPFALRIDDIHHNYENTDRFTEQLWIKTGINHIRIDLDKVRKAPAGRETDMASIQRIILFVHRPSHPIVVYLGRVWLE